MTELQEQLSMLWSGELPLPVADALRRRIATEPAVAREWERLAAALEALESLPDALPPPPVVHPTPRIAPQPPPTRSWGVPLAALAAAAAVALAVGISRRPPPELLLASGSQWVQGEVDLRAGDVAVAVDGDVWISVEPRAPLPRGGAAEVPMDRKVVMAAVAGAVVTVSVFEGTAVVRAATGAPVVVHAGETRQVGAPSTPRPAVPGLDRAQNIARLEQELAAVQQELDQAKFEGALTRGQLQALQGTPSPWPDHVPPALRPDQFRATLEARLADVPDVEVAEIDCDEYPCVAAVAYTGPATGDDWNAPLGAAVHGFAEAELGDHASLSLNTSVFRTDDAEARYVIFGLHDEDRETDVGRRTEFRIDAMVDLLGQQLKDAP